MRNVIEQIGIWGGFWFAVSFSLLALYLILHGLCVACRNIKYWLHDRKLDRKLKALIKECTHEIK